MKKNICQFCPISKESYRSQIIIETPTATAIHPRRLLSRGHTIIFPKVHKGSVLDMSDTEITDLFKLIKRVGKSLTKVYRANSFNLFANIGERAGQSIPHLHFHIVLRFPNETTSPFKILNDRKAYDALKVVTPQERVKNINKIRAGLKRQ